MLQAFNSFLFPINISYIFAVWGSGGQVSSGSVATVVAMTRDMDGQPITHGGETFVAKLLSLEGETM